MWCNPERHCWYGPFLVWAGRVQWCKNRKQNVHTCVIKDFKVCVTIYELSRHFSCWRSNIFNQSFTVCNLESDRPRLEGHGIVAGKSIGNFLFVFMSRLYLVPMHYLLTVLKLSKYSWLFSNVNYICNLGFHNLAVSCVEAVPLCFSTQCIHHLQGEGERGREVY
jgi:hypothetical protein